MNPSQEDVQAKKGREWHPVMGAAVQGVLMCILYDRIGDLKKSTEQVSSSLFAGKCNACPPQMATALAGSRGMNNTSERFMIPSAGISESGGCPPISYSRVPLPHCWLMHNRLVGQEQSHGKGLAWSNVLIFLASADLVKGLGQYWIQSFFWDMNVSLSYFTTSYSSKWLF